MIYIVQKRISSTPAHEFYGPFATVAEAAAWAQKELGEATYDIRTVMEPWK